jgi:hypothetical protein
MLTASRRTEANSDVTSTKTQECKPEQPMNEDIIAVASDLDLR